MGEYSSCSQISRIKPYHATTIPLPDVLLSCKKLPRCWEQGESEREREREGEKKEARGGSRPRSRRRRGDAFKDTAALSLFKVNKEQDSKKIVPCGQGNCEGRGRGVGCASFWVGYVFHLPFFFFLHKYPIGQSATASSSSRRRPRRGK